MKRTGKVLTHWPNVAQQGALRQVRYITNAHEGLQGPKALKGIMLRAAPGQSHWSLTMTQWKRYRPFPILQMRLKLTATETTSLRRSSR